MRHSKGISAWGWLAIVSACAVTVTMILLATRGNASMAWAQGVPVEVRVVRQINGESWVEYDFQGSDEIERLVLAPLRAAVVDAEPANYVVFGTLHARFDNGEEESVFLFYPFGHFARGDEYYVADLRDLASKMEEVFVDSAKTFKAINSKKKPPID